MDMNQLRMLLLALALVAPNGWGQGIADLMTRLLLPSNGVALKGGGASDPSGKAMYEPPAVTQEDGSACVDPNGRPKPCGG